MTSNKHAAFEIRKYNFLGNDIIKSTTYTPNTPVT